MVEEEIAMDTDARRESTIGYFQGKAQLTPITVSADFAALAPPKQINDDAATVEATKNDDEESC